MSSKLNNGAITTALQNFRYTVSSTRLFPKILYYFEPKINDLANGFPYLWRDDFVQEGKIGLHQALISFAPSNPAAEFPFYALSAIKNKMYDFYRSVIDRNNATEVEFDDAGVGFEIKKPIIVQMPYLVNEDGEEECLIEQYSLDMNYETNLTRAIDVKYNSSSTGLKRNNFSQREITVFDLHYTRGFSTTEVANLLQISVSYASKIISNINNKIKKFL